MVCTQGTIIYSIRSDAHPQKRCYGVIVTARCDIAQGKTNTLHCLAAQDLVDWVKSGLFCDLIEDQKNECLSTIRKWALENHLDFELLLELGPNKAKKNIESESQKNRRESLIKACNQWEKYIGMVPSQLAETEILELLNGDLKKSKANKLSLLLGNRLTGYCFIPKCAYSKSDSKVDGLVVDLKDLKTITVEDAENIKAYKYDYNLLKDEIPSRLQRLNERFFLEGPEDIVVFDNEIRSPWIEHLMQNFAMSFIRIGVDGATNDEIKAFSLEDIE